MYNVLNHLNIREKLGTGNFVFSFFRQSYIYDE